MKILFISNKIKIFINNILIKLLNFYENKIKCLFFGLKESCYICINKIGIEIILTLSIGFMLFILGIDATNYLEDGLGIILIAVLGIVKKILDNLKGIQWYESLLRKGWFTIVILVASSYLLYYYLFKGKRKAD